VTNLVIYKYCVISVINIAHFAIKYQVTLYYVTFSNNNNNNNLS